MLALLARPLGAGGAGEPAAPSPVLAAVSTPFPATALLAVPTADGADARRPARGVERVGGQDQARGPRLAGLAHARGSPAAGDAAVAAALAAALAAAPAVPGLLRPV